MSQIYFIGVTLCMFRTVFPYIIRSSRLYILQQRNRVSAVVKVLCYKSEGRWFDRTMALGSTQPLTEMSTRSISWG